MKLPAQRTGINTLGALSVTLISLISLEAISVWWLILAVPMLFVAVGLESGSSS